MAARNPHVRISDISTSSGGTIKSTSTAATAYSSVSLPYAAQLETQEFVNLRRLYADVNSSNNDCLIYHGILEETYMHIDKKRETSGWNYRLFFLEDLKILIITIPTTSHERLHIQLYDEIKAEIANMGLRTGWVSNGTATKTSGRSRGEGDSTGGPRDMRRRGSDWPTIVAEAGHSQSWPSLHIKMRWWFEASGGQVKIVILAKFEEQRRIIALEKWTQRPQESRAGATATRSFAAVQAEPRLAHSITITRPPGVAAQASQFIVQGAPLILEFGILFLRPPDQHEDDVQITELRFRDWAELIWDALE